MMTPDSSNELFNLAYNFVEETSQSIFLTGKAGTGKTTFLRYVKKNTRKNTVIVAPTGVAAINAGGTTIHSFFQLPFTPFVPTTHELFSVAQAGMSHRHPLLSQMHISSQKQELFQKLELLIIDEVSMLRCDVLDAIDLVLRHYRNDMYHPFGGVQVLFIGDLYQLPPVIANDQWAILKDYYNAPYFFHAKVIQQDPPLYIELKKIYRQKQEEFIHLLNHIRNNQFDETDLFLLNKLYQPGRMPSEEGYIMLTTHHARAEATNQMQLAKLNDELHTFQASIEGVFSEKSYPADKVLHLKKGAQVMFLKNDLAHPKRYYNGKIGTVSSFEDNGIWVIPNGTEEAVYVEKEIWKNIVYTYNTAKHQIEEEEIGSFVQYPLKLAWAITIHKSQGLTFEKAVIDAGAAFASGQVYVALSRCVSLEGIILHSKILPEAIYTDPEVIRFAEEETDATRLEKIYKHAKQIHNLNRFSKLILMEDLIRLVHQHRAIVLASKSVGKIELLSGYDIAYRELQMLQSAAQRFLNSFSSFSADMDGSFLHEQAEPMLTHFQNVLEKIILADLHKIQTLLSGKKGAKKYEKMLSHVIQECKHTLTNLQQSASLLSYVV